MKTKYLFGFVFFLCFCFFQTIYGQKEFEVREMNTANYPQVSGKLWVRNPDGVNTNRLKFVENDVALNVHFELFKHSDSLPKNKGILFLVLNSTNTNDLTWYQKVILGSLSNSVIKDGDKIAVASFTCKNNGKFVFPNNLQFSDDIATISRKVDSIKYQPRSTLYQGKSQVYLALNEALTLLEQQNLEMPTGIIVVSDDRNFDPNFAGERPVERSRRLNIPVYCICLDRYQKSYEIEDLCKQTYGLYNAFTVQEQASKQIQIYLKNFIQRQAGLYYPFRYNSTFEKDGKAHLVKIDSPKEKSSFNLTTPNRTLFEWISDNVLLSVGLFLLLISGMVFLWIMAKKNKLSKEALELKKQEQIRAMELQQQEAREKIAKQSQEIDAINQLRQKQKEEQEQLRIKAQQQLEDEMQFKKMLERGNLPWFEFKVGENQGSYQIASPRLSVGRDESSDWVIPHPTVSRKHFELSFKDYVYTIKDLGSANGLFVNGERVKEIELRHGDLIQAGELILTFHI